jgi:L-fuculose-phosphate aldolase
MLLANERELIARFGRRMTSERLVVGTSGNLSIRDGGLLAVTPSGHAYDTLAPELVCVNRLDGSQVEGELAPTSELPIHQLIYEHTEAAAVVHTHSTAATVVSTLVEELPTIHYILAVMGGPIRVAPYATFGSQQLADNVLAAIEGRSGVLLANHGAVTYGPTMEVAYACLGARLHAPYPRRRGDGRGLCQDRRRLRHQRPPPDPAGQLAGARDSVSAGISSQEGACRPWGSTPGPTCTTSS